MNNATLSQDEINALLGGGLPTQSVDTEKTLTDEEKDVIGEVGNICMGTAATTLFTIVNNRVTITTPTVEVLSKEQLLSYFGNGVVATSVKYTQGVEGTNLMVISDDDVKVITDLMMGGPGVAVEGPLTELHLSAISEVMNQMIGSTSTALSNILGEKIDISPPKSTTIDTSKDWLCEIDEDMGTVAIISFHMEIENILDSSLIQVLPMPFAKGMIERVINNGQSKEVPAQEIKHTANVPQKTEVKTASPSPVRDYATTPNGQAIVRNVEVSKPIFPSLDEQHTMAPKENIELLMDVPLNVSVELGRTTKKIKEILEFSPGTVIELDRLIGEPIDVLVNGKCIAKGEVVVMDENFGIRITDIINPEHRIREIK